MFDELILSINSNIKARETDSQKICLRASFQSNRTQETSGQQASDATLEQVSGPRLLGLCLCGARIWGSGWGGGSGPGAGGRGHAGGREILNTRRLFQAEAHIKVGAPQGPCSSLRLGQPYIPGANKVI